MQLETFPAEGLHPLPDVAHLAVACLVVAHPAVAHPAAFEHPATGQLASVAVGQHLVERLRLEFVEQVERYQVALALQLH